MKSITPQAKPEGTEWCKTCNAWVLHESDGECRNCGRQLFRESTSVMVADWVSKGYLLS